MVSCRYNEAEKRVVWDIQVKSLGELIEALHAIQESMNKANFDLWKGED